MAAAGKELLSLPHARQRLREESMADILRVKKDVARLLRLSADSIRFYEKRGIIHIGV